MSKKAQESLPQIMSPSKDVVSPLDPDLLGRLQGLKVQMQRVVEGVLAGLHRSARTGVSIEFVEHKEYSPGDDPRHLDWRVLGRLDRYAIKKFEDETNLQAVLAVDISGSMDYGSGAFTKAAYSSLMAASLGALLLRQGDEAGLMLSSGSNPGFLPPQGRADQLHEMVSMLENASPEGPTMLGQLAGRFMEFSKRKSMLVLFSDLFDSDERVIPSLKMLAARGHEVVVFHVLDPDELGFPFQDPTLFESMEDDRSLLVFPREVRNAYLEEMREFLNRSSRQLSDSGLSYELVRTDEPPHQPLLRFLSSRA